MVLLSVIPKQRKQVWKISFTIKNEIEAEGLSRPKSTNLVIIASMGDKSLSTIGFLTVLRCTSGPNLVIPNLNGWKVIMRTSSKWGKIRLSSWIWPWRSRSITPKNNRLLNQGVLHLWSKFGDSSFKGWWAIVRTSKWLIHTHGTQTDTQTQAMTIPEAQNWPRVKINCQPQGHLSQQTWC